MTNIEIRGRSKNFVVYQMKLFATFYHYNCCEELHLKCGGVPGSIFENFAISKNWFGLPVLFLFILKCGHLY